MASLPSEPRVRLLTEHKAKLISEFSKTGQFNSICSKLLQRNIISKESHDAVTKLAATSTQLSSSKAEELVILILRHIQEKPAKLDDLLDLLDKEACFKKIVQEVRTRQLDTIGGGFDSDCVEDEIEMACLGRPFRVGMFYNCVNDNLLLNISLCKDEDMKQILVEQPQVSCRSEVIEDDSLETKAKSLHLNTPLKLSLLSKLVHDNSKSSKYWNDRCKSKRQVRVCLKYTSTTGKILLPLSKLAHIEKQIFEHATHVVTGVLYGLDAYCVFDRMLIRENDRYEDAHKNMITKVKSRQTAASQSVSQSDSLFSIMDCQVYSDLNSSAGPFTFQEIAELFRKLPSMSADEKPCPIPQKVWLYPLKKLDSKCISVVKQVKTKLVDQLQEILESLYNIEILAGDLMKKYSDSFSRFQNIENRISKFIEITQTYKNDLQKKIANLVPQIRQHKVDESEFEAIIATHFSSSFKFQYLSAWLKKVEEEISAADTLVGPLNNIDFISSQELQLMLEDLSSDHVVCLVVHVALDDDEFINLLQSYSKTGNVRQHHGTLHTPLTEWYRNTELMKKLTSNIDRFRVFAENNSKTVSFVKFVMVNQASNNMYSDLLNEPSTILLYEGTTHKPWEPPGPPGKPTVKEVTHDTVYIDWSRPEYGSHSVECYQVSYHTVDNPEVIRAKKTKSSQELTMTLTGLTPETMYVFSVQSKCSAGIAGRKGDRTFATTKAVSLSVSKPLATSMTHDSITLQWCLPPSGNNIVNFYYVFYRSVSNPPNKWKKKTSDGSKQSIVISDLSPKTKYEFKVRPELNTGVGKESQLSDPIQTNPLPLSPPDALLCQPGKPTPTAISHDSITVHWDKPVHKYEMVESYVLKYCCIDDPNKLWKFEILDNPVEEYTISGLNPSTNYVFLVRPELEDSSPGTESETSDLIMTEEKSASPGDQLAKPKATTITHDSITLHWINPGYSDKVESYIARYRCVDDRLNKKWKQIMIKSSKGEFIVTNLDPSTKYVFQIQHELKNGGIGAASGTSDPIMTKAHSSQLDVPKVIAITHNSITLQCTNVNPSDESYKIIVRYSCTDKKEWKRKLLTKCIKQEWTITGLKPNTRYIFQIQHELENGGVVSVSKLTDPICTRCTSSPSKPIASVVTHHSIMLSWTKPELIAQDIKKYKILYSSPRNDHDKEHKEHLTSNSEESILIEELCINTQYTFQVIPICGTGDNLGNASEISDPIKTKPSSSPGKPTAIAITHNSVTLKWSKPEFGSKNVNVYIVRYECVGMSKELRTNISVAEVKNLDMRRVYTLKVLPECGEAGVGMESKTSVIKTLATSPPGKPTVSEVTHESVKLHWIKPEEMATDTNIQSYEVYYKKVEQTIWQMKVTSGPKESSIVTKIDYASKYEFKVLPRCSVGKGSESKVSNPVFTKATSPPGIPNVFEITQTTVQLEWTKPELGSDKISHYTIYICSGIGKVSKSVVYTHNEAEQLTCKAIVKELDPETEYTFKVQPHCHIKHGADSKLSKPIKTLPVYYKPGKPQAKTIKYEEIKLVWEMPIHKGHEVQKYEVEFRYYSDSTSSWTESSKSRDISSQCSCELNKLIPGKVYLFRVKSFIRDSSSGKLMLGAVSDSSIPVRTKTTTSPGKPVAVNIFWKRIELRWTHPEHHIEDIDHYVIKYVEKKSLTKNILSYKVSGTENNCIVYNLKCKTQYEFVVVPHCKKGEGEQSVRSDPVETLPSCKPGKATLITATHDTITLSWTSPDFYSEHVDYYQITYHDMNAIRKDDTENKRLSGRGILKPEICIDGLKCNTSYIFEILPILKRNMADSKVQIDTENSTSDPIDTVATSLPGKPIKCNTTYDSITLKWVKPTEGHLRIKHYKVMYYQSKSKWRYSHKPVTQQLITDTDKVVVTVKNLLFGTNYQFKVQAVCHSAREDKDTLGMESENSDPIQTNATSPPSRPVASQITHNSVTLFWNSPMFGSYEIDYYTICKSNDGKNWTYFMPTVKQKHKAPNHQVSQNVPNLKPGTFYFFRIKSVCTNNGIGSNSEASNPVVTKEIAPPGKPQEYRVTHDSIVIKWKRPDFGQERIEYYQILCAKLHSGKVTIWDSENIDEQDKKAEYINFCKKNLEEKTEYVFKVLPVCQDDPAKGTESEQSDPIITKATSPPGQPRATKVTHNSIHLEWKKPDIGVPKSYDIYWKVAIDQQNWEFVANTLQDCYTITDQKVHPETQYYFKIRPQCDHYSGTDSVRSELVTTNPVCKPTQLGYFKKTHDSVTLTWTPPKHGSHIIKHYVVSYKCKADSDFKTTLSNTDTLLIPRLKHSTWYTFKVQAELKYQDSKIGIVFSDEFYVQTASPPLAVNLYDKARSDPRWHVNNSSIPAVYKVPEVKYRVIDERGCKFAKCHFGSRSRQGSGKQEKVLMLVGATGEGKSTLIEFMVNYFLGVKWGNKFRFQMIEQDGTSQTQSQTKFITAYTLYPSKDSALDYILTIIDTPGYGDTRGIKSDYALTDQIEKFFSNSKGINYIDGIGFVLKSSSVRLNAMQKHVFDSILRIFGEDMKNNIFLMITFSDAQIPPVLEAVHTQEIPYVGHFKFNNSALYVYNENPNDMISLSFWKMGVSALQDFFAEFKQMDAIGLGKTQAVLEERKQLGILIEGLQRQITTSIDLIRQLQHDKEAIQRNEDSDEPFMYDVEVIRSVEETVKKRATVCMKCKLTCHHPCTITKSHKLYKCAAMSGNFLTRNERSHCLVCKCSWKEHSNKEFKYVMKTVKENRTLDELVKEYISTAGDQRLSANKKIKAMGVVEQRLKEVYDKVLHLIEQTQLSIDRIDDLALRKCDPDYNPQIEYLDLLISVEEESKRPGSEQHIASLKSLRDRARITLHAIRSHRDRQAKKT